jgi:hypothetical protein
LKFQILIIERASRGQVGWLYSVVPADQEVEIKRITAGGQPGEKVSEIPLNKQTKQNNPSCTGGIGRRIVVGG